MKNPLIVEKIEILKSWLSSASRWNGKQTWERERAQKVNKNTIITSVWMSCEFRRQTFELKVRLADFDFQKHFPVIIWSVKPTPVVRVVFWEKPVSHSHDTGLHDTRLILLIIWIHYPTSLADFIGLTRSQAARRCHRLRML